LPWTNTPAYYEHLAEEEEEEAEAAPEPMLRV